MGRGDHALSGAQSGAAVLDRRRDVRELEGGVSEPARPPRRHLRWPAIAAISAATALAAGALGDVVSHRGASSGAAAPPAGVRRSVAVFGFKNLTGRADVGWLATALAEMISMEIGAGDRLRTISGEEVAHARVDLALPDAETYSKETLAKLREQLGADLVIVGSYLTLGNDKAEQLRVNARVQDTRTGELVGAGERRRDNRAGRGSRDARRRSAARPARPRGSLVGRSRRGPGGGADESRGIAGVLRGPREAARVRRDGGAHLARASRDARAGPSDDPLRARRGVDGARLRSQGAGGGEAREDELAASLPQLERRLVEARYREAAKDWDGAIAIYHKLAAELPDDLEHGLRLANAQVAGSKATEALATVGELRALPAPLRDDPRIDLVEAAAADAMATTRARSPRRITCSRRDSASRRGSRISRGVTPRTTRARRAGDHRLRCGDRGVRRDRRSQRRGARIGSKGFALYDLGERTASVAMYQRAAAIWRELGNRKNLRR